MRISVLATVSADLTRRTLTGNVYRYGEVGRTSAGPLRVGPSMPPPPIGLPATLEHDRGVIRGHVALVDNSGERLRIAVRVVDGELGDAALADAINRERAAFSLDIEDAEVVDGVIVSGRWEAIGQVAQPAFNSARIDSIAASANPGEPMLTDAQRARLNELLAISNRNAAEQSEFTALMTIANGGTAPVAPEAPSTAPATAAPAQSTATTETTEAPAAEAAAPQAVAASIPAVPTGVPTSTTTTRPRGMAQIVRDVTAALRAPGGPSVSAITAALSDIVHSDHTSDIEPVAWSGELWSGLQYEPEWSDLFATGPLTHWEGKGWRFTSKLEIQDYAGDKAAIPSGDVTTEDSSYEAARMAVGVDIDRKFYDFPNEGFVNGLFEQVRESWEIKLDAKVRAYALAQAVAGSRTISISRTNGDATVTAPAGTFRPSDKGASISGTGIPNGTTILSVTDDGEIEMSAAATATAASTTATLGAREGTVLKAAARARLILKRRKVGNASFIVLNDEDMFTLLDVAEKEVPAWLEIWGVDPKNFRSSADVARGTLLAGVKQAAVVRTLPGSPIRVSAQNLANGGVDEAFFGYWAIEEHHDSGLVTVGFNPVTAFEGE